MYEYVDDKQFIMSMRSYCGDLMQDLCHTLKEERDIGAMFYLIGSGERNMIAINEYVSAFNLSNSRFDLDYNLEIVRIDDWEDCEYIKECVRKSFNKVLRKNGLEDCQDSTSCLTAKNMHLPAENNIKFSMDVGIVCEDDDGNLCRLIHKKTGDTHNDEYSWNIAPNTKDINDKVHYIKRNGKWELVRKEYKKIKNNYFKKNDHYHSSFICYIEAVNNVYNSRKYWK